MEEIKYRLTEESVVVNDKTLYRIEAIKDFGDVHKGDKGGFVENETNLSQSGECWVYDNAMVYYNAMVCDDAEVHDKAVVCGYAMVGDGAKVYGNTNVFGYARICGNAMVYGNA